MTRLLLCRFAAALLSGSTAALAAVQLAPYPGQPVRIIVPQPPGGG
jgi:tripartite-type tricarboxylate transporter receptor subunit TctC